MGRMRSAALHLASTQFNVKTFLWHFRRDCVIRASLAFAPTPDVSQRPRIFWTLCALRGLDAHSGCFFIWTKAGKRKASSATDHLTLLFNIWTLFFKLLRCRLKDKYARNYPPDRVSRNSRGRRADSREGGYKSECRPAFGRLPRLRSLRSSSARPSGSRCILRISISSRTESSAERPNWTERPPESTRPPCPGY
jgi:hypothetical protein